MLRRKRPVSAALLVAAPFLRVPRLSPRAFCVLVAVNELGACRGARAPCTCLLFRASRGRVPMSCERACCVRQGLRDVACPADPSRTMSVVESGFRGAAFLSGHVDIA